MIITFKNYRCFPNNTTIDLSNFFTAFVGLNNAGKSSILRFAYEFRPTFRSIINRSNNIISMLGNGYAIQVAASDPDEIFTKPPRGELQIKIDVSNQPHWASSDLGEICIIIIIIIDSNSKMLRIALYCDSRRLNIDTDLHVTTIKKKEHKSDRFVLCENSTRKRIYDITPITDAIHTLIESMYIGSFRNPINSGGMQLFDIDVGQSFIRHLSDWQTGNNVKNREAALEFEEMVRQRFGFGAFRISTSHNSSEIYCTVDGKSFRLGELGTGVAQFILVLANLAIRRPTIVFIDEPELGLHPSLQRDFLISIATYTEKVVFATHSLGLAHCDADLVYSVRSRERGVSEVHAWGETPRLSEFLGELSYAGYREIGYESILLVEGPTEVKAFRHFLGLFGKDRKVVLVQLGGSSMINGKRREELSEMLQICNRVFAVVDSDRTAPGGEAKRAAVAFEGVCQSLNIRCLVTERGATENYMTDAAVKAELGSAKATIGPYQKLDENANWKKDSNWKIARHMTRADIEITDLGQFLASL